MKPPHENMDVQEDVSRRICALLVLHMVVLINIYEYINTHIYTYIYIKKEDVSRRISYRVAKTHRIPKVADHFPQKSH